MRKGDFMERQSTRKCEQLELHVILVVCCWRDFCLDCRSDSCLDVLEWKSAPNVPRDKPQNCQKTLFAFISKDLEFEMRSPHSPTQHKNTALQSWSCAVPHYGQLHKQLPPKAPKWVTCVANCPDILSRFMTLESLPVSNPIVNNNQEPQKYPFGLTSCQARAILVNSIFILHFLSCSKEHGIC